MDDLNKNANLSIFLQVKAENIFQPVGELSRHFLTTIFRCSFIIVSIFAHAHRHVLSRFVSFQSIRVDS